MSTVKDSFEGVADTSRRGGGQNYGILSSGANTVKPQLTDVIGVSSSMALMNQPTFIQWNRWKFLILDAPHHHNIYYYLQELHRYEVTHLVRTCERTYDDFVVQDAGITPHALIFPDGEPPSKAIIQEWLDLVADSSRRNATLAVHCLAGLGRAPVLVVIALIESGMHNVEAIEFVRSRRRGAINKKQLEYLMSYKKCRRSSQKKCCGIM